MNLDAATRDRMKITGETGRRAMARILALNPSEEYAILPGSQGAALWRSLREHGLACRGVDNASGKERWWLSKQIAVVIDSNHFETRILARDLFLACHTLATNFNVMLFRLISKADLTNRDRFRSGFPLAVDVFEAWERSSDEQTFFATMKLEELIQLPERSIFLRMMAK